MFKIMLQLLLLTNLTSSIVLVNGFIVAPKSISSSSSSTTTSFIVQRRNQQQRRHVRCMAATSGNNDNDNDNMMNNNQDALQSRTCIQNFLNQRAIQNMIYLLNSFRDPHTMRWLETKLESHNLLKFHGTGALNVTKLGGSWDNMLMNILHLPSEKVIIKQKRRVPKRRNGIDSTTNKKNPYIQEKYVEFEIDIDPKSLISRILSVREQIASEWATSDLDTLIRANDMILSSYLHNQQIHRYHEENENDINDDKTDNIDNDVTTTTSLTSPYSDKTPATTTTASGGPGPAAQQTGGEGNSDNSGNGNGSGSGVVSYDRNAMVYFYNSNAFRQSTSSTLRTASFDLLLLLSTQESIHRVLKEYRESNESYEREVCFEWLKTFYNSKLDKYFDGHLQAYGASDDFLDELLLTPPSVVKKGNNNNNNNKEDHQDNNNNNKDNNVDLIDPLRIAEDIIMMRSIVAQDWKQIVSNTPQDHMIIRKALLAKQMESQSSSNSAFLSAIEEEESSDVTQSSSTTNTNTIIFETAEDFQ